jgi:hypothetical protein
VREGPVQLGHSRVAEFQEVAENVSFRLVNIGRVPLDEKADPMGRAVDGKDEPERHSSQAYANHLA